MAEAELFAHPDYPVPGHGKVWFAHDARRRAAALRQLAADGEAGARHGHPGPGPGRVHRALQRDDRRAAPPRLPRRHLRLARPGRLAALRRAAGARAMSGGCGITRTTSLWRWRRCTSALPAPYFVLAHSMGAAICLDAARRGRAAGLAAGRAGADARPHHHRAARRPPAGWRACCSGSGFGKAFVPGGGDTAIATKPFDGNRLTGDPVRYARNSALSAAGAAISPIGDPTIGWVRTAFQLMARLDRARSGRRGPRADPDRRGGTGPASSRPRRSSASPRGSRPARRWCCRRRATRS